MLFYLPDCKRRCIISAVTGSSEYPVRSMRAYYNAVVDYHEDGFIYLAYFYIFYRNPGKEVLA